MSAKHAEDRHLVPRVRRLLERYALLRYGLQAVGSFGFCLLLAAARIDSRCLPLALIPVCALPFGVVSVSAYAGALLGYLLFWGAGQGLEPIAAGFLLLAGSCLFRDLLPAQRRWFAPAAAGSVYLLLGIIFALQQDNGLQAALLLLLRLGLLVVGSWALSPAQPRQIRLCAAGLCLLAALAGMEGTIFPLLAVAAAVCVCVRHAGGAEGMLLCAVCGLTLDLCCMPQPPQTACFCLAALSCRMGAPRKMAQAALFAGGYFAAVLFWGGAHAGWMLGALAGAIAACLVPASIRVEPRTAQAAVLLPQTIRQASQLLQTMESSLSGGQTHEAGPAPALLFDSAAERICSSCVRQQACWQERADETYQLLSGCANRIIRREELTAEDLPAQFRAICIRAPAFAAEITRALRVQRMQLQALARADEARRAAAAVYGHLAHLFAALQETRDHVPPRKFELELGVRAIGLRGDQLNGDCGTSFSSGGTQFVLLCDGMGTGAAAQADARRAIACLQQLLTLGLDAPEALQMLNELYILRADGCFATVDLLAIALESGDGTLYKWGAAPSYLKKGASVKKIGTASPPPGLGVGEEHHAECVRLSLQRGEQLVLTTDGVPEQCCEQYLRSCGELPPRELAAGVVACASESEPDDRTAVVVTLRPVALQTHHTTRRAQNLSKSGA